MNTKSSQAVAESHHLEHSPKRDEAQPMVSQIQYSYICKKVDHVLDKTILQYLSSGHI